MFSIITRSCEFIFVSKTNTTHSQQQNNSNGYYLLYSYRQSVHLMAHRRKYISNSSKKQSKSKSMYIMNHDYVYNPCLSAPSSLPDCLYI